MKTGTLKKWLQRLFVNWNVISVILFVILLFKNMLVTFKLIIVQVQYQLLCKRRDVLGKQKKKPNFHLKFYFLNSNFKLKDQKSILILNIYFHSFFNCSSPECIEIGSSSLYKRALLAVYRQLSWDLHVHQNTGWENVIQICCPILKV